MIFVLFPGGYYTIELAKRRLRLISLNTNLYLSTSLRERYSYDLDTEESWAWLHKVMAQAKSKGQNVSKLFVLTLKLGGKMGPPWADSRRKFRSYRVTWAVLGDPSNNGNGERAQAKCIDRREGQFKRPPEMENARPSNINDISSPLLREAEPISQILGSN